jgi:multiple sugar transport system permease protein
MALARHRRYFAKEPTTGFRDLDPRHRRFLMGAVVTLVTATIAFVYLLPFGYMAMTSLKTEQQITRSTILPRSPRTVEYAFAEFDLVRVTDEDGDLVGATILPDGVAADAETLTWDGTWDEFTDVVGAEAMADGVIYSAGSGRAAESGITVLLPGVDPVVLLEGDAAPEPLDFDGTEVSLAAALDATGYTLDDVLLFAMPAVDEATPALALLRPGAATNAMVDPRLLPSAVEWDRTFAGLAPAVADALGVEVGDVGLFTVPDADGSLNGVGLLAPGGDPAVFVDPATVRPEPVEFDAASSTVGDLLDDTFAVAPRELDLRRVPMPDGTTRTLALLRPGPESSVFVDPDDPTAEPIEWTGRVLATEQVLDLDANFGNYEQAWDALDFTRRLRNTAFIAGLGMAGTVFASTLVAYGLSRFRIPFKGLILASLVATIILPRFVTLVPTYIVFERIGWVGTWWPLIVPHFFANAYNVFLLRQFFLTIPRDLDEAAAIDGAGPMRTLFTVILPQARGALLAVALFHFFFAWNDFLEPLLYLASEPDLQPISLGLYFFIGIFDSNVPLIQAGALLGMAVPILVFLALQKVFLSGIDLSGSVK